MPTSRVVLYDSFSYLLRLIKRGNFTGDSPNHIYYFGCTGTVEGVMNTVRLYEFPEDRIIEVLEMLARAEQDKRVFWRSADPLSDECERFCRMLQRARLMGATIPLWDFESAHHDAYWNIPAMRQFLGNSVAYANNI